MKLAQHIGENLEIKFRRNGVLLPMNLQFENHCITSLASAIYLSFLVLINN